MALYHFAMQNIGRSDGRSAVACASYRSGEALYDEREETTFKFQREDRVAHTEIIAPIFAPKWVSDRGQLWNSVEANEKRKDARLSREFEVSLPHELDLKQQQELIRAWAHEQLTPLGLVCDVAIHKRPDEGERNDHAHVMTTPRGLEPDGTWAKTKNTSLNSKEQLEQWRASWAIHVNQALERAGEEDRVDHRSNRSRGLELVPTVHVGYKSQAIEKRGGRSWRMDKNRQIRETNLRILLGIKARAIAGFKETAKWFAMKMAPDKLGLELTPEAPTIAPKKPKPEPVPIAAKLEPTKSPQIQPRPVPQIEDEDEDKKQKKAANLAAANLAAAIERGRGRGDIG